jgi:hypothetical protein
MIKPELRTLQTECRFRDRNARKGCGMHHVLNFSYVDQTVELCSTSQLQQLNTKISPSPSAIMATDGFDFLNMSEEGMRPLFPSQPLLMTPRQTPCRTTTSNRKQAVPTGQQTSLTTGFPVV